MKKLESSLKNMVIVLTGVTVVAGALLGYVNELTKEPIAQANAKALSDAIAIVVPGFDNNPAEAPETIELEGVTYKIYKATKGGEFIGAAVESSANGFGGALNVLVGFDKEGNIIDYSLLSHAETPGLGSKAADWFKKGGKGVITEVYCEYDANTRSGMPDANRKVKGTLHWVSCNHCLQAEVRLYDRLWKVENPRDELAAIREAKNCEALEAMKEIINPDSLKVLPNCYIEKFAATLPTLSYLQFQRIGYFNIDKESTPEKLIFNRTVGLKDTWGKINK